MSDTSRDQSNAQGDEGREGMRKVALQRLRSLVDSVESGELITLSVGENRPVPTSYSIVFTFDVVKPSPADDCFFHLTHGKG